MREGPKKCGCFFYVLLTCCSLTVFQSCSHHDPKVSAASTQVLPSNHRALSPLLKLTPEDVTFPEPIEAREHHDAHVPSFCRLCFRSIFVRGCHLDYVIRPALSPVYLLILMVSRCVFLLNGKWQRGRFQDQFN